MSQTFTAKSRTFSDSSAFQFYQGVLGYRLSSTDLILSVIIILQNSLVISCYIKQRARFSASMYIAIAVADIVAAQGGIVLSGAGILVADRKMDIQILYYSLYYYIATAGLAQTCSKVYNAVLSTVMSVNLANPFRRLQFRKIRLFVAVFTIISCVLCICDGVTLLYLELSNTNVRIRSFHEMTTVVVNVPGVTSLAALVCFGFKADFCFPYVNRLIETPILFIIFLLYNVLPPLVFMISAISLGINLRKTANEHDYISLASNARHVSVTVFLLASSSFVCHFAVTVIFIVYYINYVHDFNVSLTFVETGRIVGITEITLPLLNAALFPAILITRSVTLRQRVIASLARVQEFLTCCWGRIRRILVFENSDVSYRYLGEE